MALSSSIKIPECTSGIANSVPASELELGWSKEDKKIWIKYGLSPSYLMEMRKIEERLLGEHVCSTVDILEGKPLGACTEFAIPEVHSGIFIDEGCAINRAYWTWKRTGAVNEFEEVGRAVFKILQDPWGGSPIYLDADERKADRTEKGTVAGRDRRQLLEAAGLLGISAFATSLFGTFERMLGVGGEASNDVRTHVNTVTRHVGVIGSQLAALEQSVAGAQENSFHTARRAAFDRE